MRSIILVILSAIVLAGLFLGFWEMQPASKSDRVERAADVLPRTMPSKNRGLNGIRAGDDAWVKQYDGRGQLTSAFKTSRYTPKSDGTIDVVDPVAKFYLANHQEMQVVGKTGNVIIKDAPDPGRTGFANTGPPAPPSRGRLNDVVVTLIDDLKNVPLLTMKTDNVVFDNETYRISTEGYREKDGREIRDDEVPVHVTGQILMEGRGLTIRWNDKNGRLELLEIAHGDVLEITDPSGFSMGGAKAGKGNSPAALGGPLPGMLAAANRGAAEEILRHLPPPATRPAGELTTHPKGPPVVYQASFFDNVRINQPAADGPGDQVVIDNADRMDVDFLLKQSSSPTTAPFAGGDGAAAPATRPHAAAGPGDAAPVGAGPGIAAPAGAAPPAGAGSPAGLAATKPAPAKEPPIFVHWSGVLRITPLKVSPPVPLASGDSAVLLTGAPLSIHRVEPKGEGAEDIHCATVLYQTAGEKVWLGKSQQSPRVLVEKFPAASAKEKRPTRLISTGTVEYSRVDQKAVMSGPGSAQIPLEPDPKDPHPVMTAAWKKLAEFDFAQSAGQKQAVLRLGHLEGDVAIAHPRLALRSQTLDLLFDPASKTAATAPSQGQTEPHESSPNLRQVIATTGVFCRIEGNDGKKQIIESNRLVLDTARADNKLYARHINATGNVHAYGEDDLKAQYVDLLLRPSIKTKHAATQPASGDGSAQVDLEKMVARDGVIATSKDGSIARGDDLVVTQINGQQHTVLTGRPDATVTDVKGSIVKGGEIVFDSGDGLARVIGAGSLHAIQQASTTQPAQPMDVTWTGGAVFDGGRNRIDVDRDVRAKSIDKRGYVDTAVGDHIRIDLRPKPATQPAAAAPTVAEASPPATLPGAISPGSGRAPSALPKTAGGLKMDPFKGKEMVALNVEQNATLTSTLSAPGGAILQQFELKGPTIVVREIGPDGQPSRSITVPAAGRMLTRDHRPAPSKTQADANESGGARGATAFQWSKEMVYSEATHRADMVGDVVIVHQDDDPSQPPMHLTCQHVIAWFEPAARRAGGAEAKKKNDDNQAPMQLRYLTAEGPAVLVTHDADQMIARQVDYDPKRHVMTASGTIQNPVNFSNGATGGGVAQQVDWDTITWKMKTKNAIFDYRPPVPPAPQPSGKKKKPTTRSSK